jgi:hypothetical protein
MIHDSNETEKNKEEIYFSLFTDEELKNIDEMIRQDNYIVDFLWNILDLKMDYLLENKKKEKDQLHLHLNPKEIIKILTQYCIIIKNYIKNQQKKDTNITEYRNKMFLIFLIFY